MKGFSTKEGATVYSSIYWIAITISRFILPFIQGKSSTKLIFLYSFATFASLFGLVLIYTIDPRVGMTFGAFLIGVSNSVIFPQTLTLPRQYNYKIIKTQNNWGIPIRIYKIQ